MRVHELRIEHFRGVESLNWRPPSGLTCLVGPGDSTKSTILDALSLLLSAAWNVQFDDADFTDSDTTSDIVITATVCDLSDDLVAVEVLGSMLRGVDAAGVIHDDPMPGCDNAVTLELRVDASLEPVWSVVKDSTDEPRRLYSRTRDALAAVRLDDGSDRHLRWSRGSALTRLTGPAPEVPLLLADSHRAARKAVFESPDPQLSAAADTARKSALKTAGVSMQELRPGLDPTLYSRLGSLTLHEGELPLDTYGLGTRRLVALALQIAAGDVGTVLLVDEVENGLEPHRLSHFVRRLIEAAARGDQVLIATHSPLVLEQLSTDQLAVVRSSGQVTTATAVPEDLADVVVDYQGVVRGTPSALLARRVVIGEGATEVGFVEGILLGAEARTGRPLAGEGVHIANGSNGHQAADRARLLASLGYDVCLVVDHDDESIDAAVLAAEAVGVRVVRWSDGLCLEAQLATDLPVLELLTIVSLAVRIRIDAGLEPDVALASIRDGVQAQLSGGGSGNRIGDEPERWLAEMESEPDLRRAIGIAASKGGWFKRQTSGALLGHQVSGCDLGNGDLRAGVESLVDFAFPRDEP